MMLVGVVKTWWNKDLFCVFRLFYLRLSVISSETKWILLKKKSHMHVL